MGLRFEAWTHPSSASHVKKFDIPHVLPGASGVRELSAYSDETLSVPASKSSGLAGSWMKVFLGTTLLDEFSADRLNTPSGRPSVHTVSGLQRNGLVEGVGIAPYGYPNQRAGALDWKWGAENILPDLDLGALGNIREEWEVILVGERYSLDLSDATGGDFTLSAGSGTTAAIDHDASAGSIKSALEAIALINEVTVNRFEDDSVEIIFENPKNLTVDMTANFSGLTGTGSLTKLNDGFVTSGATFTITVDGDTTEALAWNASANTLEGTKTGSGSGIQGLTTVQDVAVTGSGTWADPWVIVFHNPPNPGSFSVTFSGTAIADRTVRGSLDPTPITKSKPVDAGAGPEEEHGSYGNPAIEVVDTPLDTGGSWTIKVNALARYSGSQVVVNVTPGQTYSNISVPVYPEIAGDYVLVLRDQYENLLTQTTPRNVALSAGSYQLLTIPTWTAPPGVTQVVVRAAVVDANPSNVGDFYVSWETATFLEGEPEATFTQIVRELLEAAQDRGTGTFLELDATDDADTLGTSLSTISFTQYVGDKYNLSHTLGEGAKLKYQWRVVPAADAEIITPAGTTTHVIQIFYVSADEIEDLTSSPGGPSVTVGSHVRSADVVSRQPEFTVAIGLGAGKLAVKVDRSSSYNNVKIERVFDCEHLATTAAVTEYLEARFDEQDTNLKAASATVLESAAHVPGVDFGEGSKIWWQFPGTLPKEARTVKRIGWTHGQVAEFEVQGSKILTGEGALAAALDMFLREPKRRRGEAPLPSPTSLAGGSATPGAYIRLNMADGQEIDTGDGEAIEWTVESTQTPRANFGTPSLPSSEVVIQQPGYYNVAVQLGWGSHLAGGSVWVVRKRGSTETTVWPEPSDPGLWTADNGQVFEGVAPAVPCLSGDSILVYVSHEDGSAQDLASASLALYMVDQTSNTSKTTVGAPLESSSTASTSHTVDLPEVPHGTLLLAALDAPSDPSVTWPAGWTELTQGRGCSVAYRVTDGSEGSTVTVTTDESVTSNQIVVPFYNPEISWASYAPTISGSVDANSASSIDPPSKTGFGTADTIYVVVVANQQRGMTPPAGWIEIAVNDSSTSTSKIGLWYKRHNSGSEDPAAWTLSATADAVVAMTAAVFGGS